MCSPSEAMKNLALLAAAVPAHELAGAAPAADLKISQNISRYLEISQAAAAAVAPVRIARGTPGQQRVSFAGNLSSVTEYSLSDHERAEKSACFGLVCSASDVYEWTDQALEASGYTEAEIRHALVTCGCSGLTAASRAIEGRRAAAGCAQPSTRDRDVRPTIEALANSIRKISPKLSLGFEKASLKDDGGDDGVVTTALDEERLLCALRIVSPNWRVSERRLQKALLEVRKNPRHEFVPAILRKVWGRVVSATHCRFSAGLWLPALAAAVLPATAVAIAQGTITCSAALAISGLCSE